MKNFKNEFYKRVNLHSCILSTGKKCFILLLIISNGMKIETERDETEERERNKRERNSLIGISTGTDMKIYNESEWEEENHKRQDIKKV